MRSPRRDAQPRRDDNADYHLSVLQYYWWMLTSDPTVLVYTLIFTLLIAIDIILHVLGYGGH